MSDWEIQQVLFKIAMLRHWGMFEEADRLEKELRELE